MSETESQRQRRRWITLGELIALAALIVSAVGVWISWKGNDQTKPTTVVEQHQAVPLTLRAKADGANLILSPVESAQALESATVTIAGTTPINVGSDGQISAADVQSALQGHDKEPKDKTLTIPVRIAARYVEAGADRRGGGAYSLRYRWEGGGLFGGRSVRLISLSR